MTVKRVIFEVPDDVCWFGWSILRERDCEKTSRQEDLWDDEIEDGMIIHVGPIYKDDQEEKT